MQPTERPTKRDPERGRSISQQMGCGSSVPVVAEQERAKQAHDSVVMKLTETQLEEFRETFNAFDLDGGGSIDNDELGDLMKTLGQEATEAELEKMIKLADADGSGDIDFEEFVTLIAHKMKDDDGALKEEKLKQAFRVFDTDNSGFIDAAEMRRMMINLGENISMSQVNEILAHFDDNGDGQISPDEVRAALPRPPSVGPCRLCARFLPCANPSFSSAVCERTCPAEAIRHRRPQTPVTKNTRQITRQKELMRE